MYTKTHCVMVVDGSGEVRRIVRLILEREGYEVVEATVAEALWELTQGSSFDLIITNQPQHFTGMGKVLYMSGAPEQDLGQHCAGILRKPFRNQELSEMVHRLIDLPVGETAHC